MTANQLYLPSGGVLDVDEKQRGVGRSLADPGVDSTHAFRCAFVAVFILIVMMFGFVMRFVCFCIAMPCFGSSMCAGRQSRVRQAEQQRQQDGKGAHIGKILQASGQARKSVMILRDIAMKAGRSASSTVRLTKPAMR